VGRALGLDACVVDQDIEPPPRLEDLPEYAFDVLFPGDVPPQPFSRMRLQVFRVSSRVISASLSLV